MIILRDTFIESFSNQEMTQTTEEVASGTHATRRSLLIQTMSKMPATWQHKESASVSTLSLLTSHNYTQCDVSVYVYAQHLTSKLSLLLVRFYQIQRIHFATE